jgi:hypothetical protein
MSGQWTRSASIDCVLRVDGPYEAWTGRDPQRLPGSRRPGSAPPPAAAGGLWLPEFDYVGDSRVGLTDAQGLDGAWNFLPEKQWFERAPAPLQAGHGRKQGALGTPAARLADVAWEFGDDGLVEADGRRLARVRFTHTYEVSGRVQQEVECFHLDPSRGYLPAYRSLDGGSVRTLDGRPYYQTYLLAARDCGDGRWFPERILSVRALIGPGATHSVQEVRVTDLDLSRPPEDALAVTLPGGSLVVSDSEFKKQFRIGSPQTIRARHLDDLEAELDATVPPPSPLVQMLTAPGAWRWPAAGAAAAALVVVLALVWRSRRKEKAGGRGDSPIAMS